MFTGEYNHTIDEKGRMIIPSKFREDLDGSFVITKGIDGCLFAYAMEDWHEFENKLKGLPLTNKNARNFSRYMLGSAANVDIDKQGRILLPQPLRSFAEIDKDLTLVGVGNRFEIWSKEKWEANCELLDGAELAENMEDLGI